MLLPRDHLACRGLRFGQADARAEGPPVTDRVLQVGEEPVGQRALARLT
jgi:hypothetical protein